MPPQLLDNFCSSFSICQKGCKISRGDKAKAMITFTDSGLVDYLLGNLTLSPYEHQALREWKKCPVKSDRKTSLSIEVLRACSSPEGFLGGIFDPEAIMRFIDSMVELETEVEIAKAEIGGNFYRDHVTHMVRTFLLAFYLNQKGKIGCNDQNLALACLFHDIAVPAADATKIMDAHANLVTHTFSWCHVSEASVNVDGDTDEFLDALGAVNRKGLLQRKDKQEDELKKVLLKGINEMEHDVLGALQLWTMLKPNIRKNLLRSLLAVALHHAKLGSNAVTTEFPELFLLILADELQEWGRKTFIVGVYQIFDANKVTVEINNAQSIKFKFDVSYGGPTVVRPGHMKPLTTEPVFGPLMQIGAKVKGLKRLNSSNCEVTVKFITGKHYVTVPFYNYYDSEAEEQWLRLYKDDSSIPEEILELSSNGIEPRGLPDSFDEVIIRLQGGQVSLYLGGRSIADYHWHTSAGPIELIFELTELYVVIGAPAIWELRDSVAEGFLTVVVPDAPHEIDVLQRKASEKKVLDSQQRIMALWGGARVYSEIPYIKDIVSIGTELLTEFRGGTIKREDIYMAVNGRVQRLTLV